MKTKSFSLICLTAIFAMGSSSGQTKADDGFKLLFNGKNLDGWYLKIRKGDQDYAKRIFAVEDGAVHVFNDTFPQEYELNTGKNFSHGLMYTKKKFSKYHLKFEYKWGKRIANNFGQWQYDAGVYYHVTKDKVWPVGIEYQVRYNHLTKTNHTGDLIRPGGASYDWFGEKKPGDDKAMTYLPQEKGGVAPPKKMWYHHAKATDNHHALDGKWNVCEIIAMGSEYSIHKLNGEVVNMIFKPSPSEGIIGFQSETAEIFYRNIQIKEFKESIPAEKFLKPKD